MTRGGGWTLPFGVGGGREGSFVHHGLDGWPWRSPGGAGGGVSQRAWTARAAAATTAMAAGPVAAAPSATGKVGAWVGMIVGAVLVVVFLGMACVGFVIWR